MGINGIGNPFARPGVYGTEGAAPSRLSEGVAADDKAQGNVVVTEVRARVSFAVATPQLAGAMNLTPDERQDYLRSVEEKAASASLNLGGKSVMLDIYAVMEMIREMGQKLRNAMRTMRQLENQAIQKNLKSQAALQREMAWCQMFGGAIVGGLQAGASIVGTAQQIKGLTKQTELGKQLGADVAKEQHELAKVGGSPDLAKKQLDEIRSKAPRGINANERLLTSDSVKPEVAAAREKVSGLQREIGELQKQKGALEDRLASGTLAGEERNTVQNQVAELKETLRGKGTELSKAVSAYNEQAGVAPGEADKLVKRYKETVSSDKAELEAAMKSRDESAKLLDELKKSPFDPRDRMQREVRAKVLEKREREFASASARVVQAREKLVSDTQNGPVVAEPRTTAKMQNEIHEAMLVEVDGYKKTYDEALAKVDNEKRINGKASAQSLQELDDAKYRYKLARAEQVYTSSTFDKLSPAKHQALSAGLMDEAVSLNKMAEGGARSSGSEKSAIYGMLIQNVSNALLGTMGQKIVEGVTQLKQAEISEMNADEKMLEEQLDQIKDLFAQDQALIQKSIELFQSVISKESQSLEEIINALKA